MIHTQIIKPILTCLSLGFLLLSSSMSHGADTNPLAYRPLPAPTKTETRQPGLLTQWLLLPLSLYTNTISRVDSDRCPSYPSCSQYAKEALQRHGVIPGLWLAIDRLIHERTEIHTNTHRIHLKDGTVRIPDQLDANDFWFFQPNQENPS